MRASLKRLHAALAASSPGTPVTESDLMWALQAVRSRAFSGPYAGALFNVVIYLCSLPKTPAAFQVAARYADSASGN